MRLLSKKQEHDAGLLHSYRQYCQEKKKKNCIYYKHSHFFGKMEAGYKHECLSWLLKYICALFFFYFIQSCWAFYSKCKPFILPVDCKYCAYYVNILFGTSIYFYINFVYSFTLSRTRYRVEFPMHFFSRTVKFQYSNALLTARRFVLL